MEKSTTNLSEINNQSNDSMFCFKDYDINDLNVLAWDCEKETTNFQFLGKIDDQTLLQNQFKDDKFKSILGHYGESTDKDAFNYLFDKGFEFFDKEKVKNDYWPVTHQPQLSLGLVDLNDSIKNEQ